MPEENVKSGKETTEYKTTVAGIVVSVIQSICGMVLAVAPSISDSVGADTKYGLIAGAAVAIAGGIQTMMLALGYTKGRAETKAAASMANVAGPEFPELP